MAVTPREPRKSKAQAPKSLGNPPPKTQAATSSRVDMDKVEHGLSFAEFDPNAHLASDLFKDSSTLERTSKADADAACESIEEKKQTLRMVQANIGLNQEVIKSGTAYQKFLGNVIDFGTAKLNNQTKFVGYQTAGIGLQIANVKLSQAQEKLTQEEIVLEGMTDITGLLREEWTEKKALKQSQIEDLRHSVYLASTKLDSEIRQLSNAAN